MTNAKLYFTEQFLLEDHKNNPEKWAERNDDKIMNVLAAILERDKISNSPKPSDS